MFLFSYSRLCSYLKSTMWMKNLLYVCISHEIKCQWVWIVLFFSFTSVQPRLSRINLSDWYVTFKIMIIIHFGEQSSLVLFHLKHTVYGAQVWCYRLLASQSPMWCHNEFTVTSHSACVISQIEITGVQSVTTNWHHMMSHCEVTLWDHCDISVRSNSHCEIRMI